MMMMGSIPCASTADDEMEKSTRSVLEKLYQLTIDIENVASCFEKFPGPLSSKPMNTDDVRYK